MLYYNRMEYYGMLHYDVIKTSKSKECNICHYWYFLNKGFKFRPNFCNGCHDLLVISMKLSIAILTIKVDDYHCIISEISKSEAINVNALFR